MLIAKAKPCDADVIVPLLFSSGVALYEFIYKTKKHQALDYIRYEFLSGRGFCGHRNVTVMLDNQRVIGVGCFYDRQQYNQLLLGSVINMLCFYGIARVWTVFVRSDYVTRYIIQKPRHRELYLASFAVHPSYQGRGWASRLLTHKIQEAKQLSYKVFGLDVASDNLRAESLYRKQGLQCVLIKSFRWYSNKVNIAASKKMELILG